MNRSSIVALSDLRRRARIFPELRAGEHAQIAGGILPNDLAISDDGLEFGKADHLGRSGLKSLEELEKENQQLRVENRALNATNQALRDVEREVNRLRLALAYRERSVFKLVPAEIITRDASTWWRTVTINRGERRTESRPTCRW